MVLNGIHQEGSAHQARTPYVPNSKLAAIASQYYLTNLPKVLFPCQVLSSACALPQRKPLALQGNSLAKHVVYILVRS